MSQANRFDTKAYVKDLIDDALSSKVMDEYELRQVLETIRNNVDSLENAE